MDGGDIEEVQVWLGPSRIHLVLGNVSSRVENDIKGVGWAGPGSSDVVSCTIVTTRVFPK
jgi:hypothetical protein